MVTEQINNRQGAARFEIRELPQGNTDHTTHVSALAEHRLAARKLYYDLGFLPFGLEAQALKIGGRYYEEEHLALRLRPA